MKFGRLGVITAACLASTAALAQSSPGLTITGVLDTGYVNTSHVLKNNTPSTKEGITDSIMGVSNIGFTGTKDLGGGDEAFYNFQIGFNPSQGKLSGGSDNLFSRNAYVGAKGQPGKLSIGKQWNFNDDWLVGSVFKGGYNAGAIFKFSEFDAVSDIYNSTIKYVSPIYSDFQLGAMYGSQQKATKIDNSSIEGGSLSNFAIKYAKGPLYLAATTFTEKSGDLSGSYKLNTLGGSYAFDSKIKLRLGQSESKIGTGTYTSVGDYSGTVSGGVTAPNAAKATASNIGIDYSLTPKVTLSADALHRKNTTNVNDSTDVTRFLAVYAWRPDISFVANVASLKNSGNASQTLVGTTSAGQSQRSLALGIRMTY